MLEWPRGLTRNCRSGIDRVCSDVVGSAHYDKIGNLAFILGPVRTCVFVDFKALPFGFKNNPSSQAPCRHNCIAYVTYSSNKEYICSLYVYNIFSINFIFFFDLKYMAYFTNLFILKMMIIFKYFTDNFFFCYRKEYIRPNKKAYSFFFIICIFCKNIRFILFYRWKQQLELKMMNGYISCATYLMQN